MRKWEDENGAELIANDFDDMIVFGALDGPESVWVALRRDDVQEVADELQTWLGAQQLAAQPDPEDIQALTDAVLMAQSELKAARDRLVKRLEEI